MALQQRTLRIDANWPAAGRAFPNIVMSRVKRVITNQAYRNMQIICIIIRRLYALRKREMTAI